MKISDAGFISPNSAAKLTLAFACLVGGAGYIAVQAGETNPYRKGDPTCSLILDGTAPSVMFPNNSNMVDAVTEAYHDQFERGVDKITPGDAVNMNEAACTRLQELGKPIVSVVALES